MNIKGFSKLPELAVHFEYSHTTSGRSGHILKDLFTWVIISKIFGGTVIYSPSWDRQRLLRPKNVKRHLSKPKKRYSGDFVFNPKTMDWAGSSIEEIASFIKWVQSRTIENNTIKVCVTSGLRIHLHQVHDWEEDGDLQRGTYTDLLEQLKELYWGINYRQRAGFSERLRKLFWLTKAQRHASWPPREIALHARRGDVADPTNRCYISMGPGGVWGADFYKECIEKLTHDFPYAKITIYSEKKNSEDLKVIPNVNLELGELKDLETHVRSMIEADLFIPSNSGLSTWICYLREGRVWIYNSDSIKQFVKNRMPTNFYKNSL